MVNRALWECKVSGNKVGVTYNNQWLEREPSEQLICCLGDSIPVLPNCMANQLVVPMYEWKLVLEATISSNADCIALICILAISMSTRRSAYFRLMVDVWRGERLVVESLSFSIMGTRVCRQVLLWTWRREHHVVQSLVLGDLIRAYLLSDCDICTVVEGGVCVVHNEDERLELVVNSEVLSLRQSEDLALQFDQLVLGDKCEQLKCRKNLE